MVIVTVDLKTGKRVSVEEVTPITTFDEKPALEIFLGAVLRSIEEENSELAG
jgi:hypothetical protein